MIPGPVAYWGEEDTGLLQNFTAKAPLTGVRDYQELCFEFKCQAFFLLMSSATPWSKRAPLPPIVTTPWAATEPLGYTQAKREKEPWAIALSISMGSLLKGVCMKVD